MIKLSDSPTKYIYGKVFFKECLAFALIRIDKSLRDKILSLKGQLKMLEVSSIEFPDHTPCVVNPNLEEELFGQEINKPFCFLEKFDTDDFQQEMTSVFVFIREDGFGWMSTPNGYVSWETTLFPYSILEQPKN